MALCVDVITRGKGGDRGSGQALPPTLLRVTLTSGRGSLALSFPILFQMSSWFFFYL